MKDNFTFWKVCGAVPRPGEISKILGTIKNLWFRNVNMSIKKPPTTKFYLLELDTPGKTTWVMSIDLFHRNVLDFYILSYRIFQQLVGGAIALPGIITITVVVHITPGIRENT